MAFFPIRVARGTEIKFQPLLETDTIMRGGVSTNILTRHQCITTMQEYQFKSLEELRLEDYKWNRKTGARAMNSASPSTPVLGPFSLSASLSSNSATAFTSPVNSAFLFSNPTPKFEFPSFEKRDLNRTFPAAAAATSSTFTFSNPSTTNFAFSKPTTTPFPILNPTSTSSGVNTTPNKPKFNIKGFSEFKCTTICTHTSTQTEEELYADKFHQGLKEMLLSSKYSDFILNVKGKEFRVHKVILAAHSPVFSAMMEHNTKEKITGVVNIDDFESITFSNLLNFMYTGKVDNLNFDNVFDLYEVADKYQVTELSSLCIKYLINNISVENFCDTLALSLRHHVKELTDAATQFFLQHSKEIALTAKWATFLTENPVAGNELFLKALALKSTCPPTLTFGGEK